MTQEDLWNVLIPAYSTALNSIADGWTVVDGFGPPNLTGNVIKIAYRTATQTQNKNGYDWDASITLEFICKDNGFGFKIPQAKAGQFLAIVNSDNQPNLLPDFKCDTTVCASNNTRESLNPVDNERSIIIRMEHNISQLKNT